MRSRPSPTTCCRDSLRIRCSGGLGSIAAKTACAVKKQLLIDFPCASAGGSLYYVGRDMKLTHRGLGITEWDWQAFLGHVNATLDAFKVRSQERSDVFGFVEGSRGQSPPPR